MANQLKLSQFIQSVYQRIGIYPTSLPQIGDSSNWRKRFFQIALIHQSTCALLFLIVDAKTLTEIGIAIYTATVVATSLFYFSFDLLYNVRKIQELIGKFEEFIKKRKPLREKLRFNQIKNKIECFRI